MKYIFERHQHQLQTIEYRLRALDPQLILKRGYSLTMKDGKVVRNVSMLCEGDIIETRLADGRIESVVSNHSPLTSNH
jgi:exodeoxyribonuclease VII large subunit